MKSIVQGVVFVAIIILTALLTGCETPASEQDPVNREFSIVIDPASDTHYHWHNYVTDEGYWEKTPNGTGGISFSIEENWITVTTNQPLNRVVFFKSTFDTPGTPVDLDSKNSFSYRYTGNNVATFDLYFN